jgi:hypothetical protein
VEVREGKAKVEAAARVGPDSTREGARTEIQTVAGKLTKVLPIDLSCSGNNFKTGTEN